jgi:CRP/FNR family transcriptional regulator, cyclic AMP receptor protein
MTAEPVFFDRAFGRTPPVRLVDEDPDLFADLDPDAREDAHNRALVPLLELEPGPWEPEDRERDLGLLVLDGFLVHSVLVTNERRSEIVGRGDVVRPWQEETTVASVPFASDWQVVDGARLAVLDQRFLSLAARWPAVLSAVVGRTVRRSHRLALQLAIADVRRVEDRLMLFLWHMADRWGRVGPEGVSVPLPVTHEVIAQLVCAQRPTVTSALKRLVDDGRVHRCSDKTWLLATDPPDASARVRAQLAPELH